MQQDLSFLQVLTSFQFLVNTHTLCLSLSLSLSVSLSLSLSLSLSSPHGIAVTPCACGASGFRVSPLSPPPHPPISPPTCENKSSRSTMWARRNTRRRGRCCASGRGVRAAKSCAGWACGQLDALVCACACACSCVCVRARVHVDVRAFVGSSFHLSFASFQCEIFPFCPFKYVAPEPSRGRVGG
jgi:hypothetical protein